jgi:hypothetical protein
MNIVCVLTSMGEVIATLAIIVLIVGPDSPRLNAHMLVLTFIGAASCAAEPRVCELAEMSAEPDR